VSDLLNGSYLSLEFVIQTGDFAMWRGFVLLSLTLGAHWGLASSSLATDLPRLLQAGEHRLTLNGSGSRTKTLLQLYEAGLYLTAPSRNPAEIVAANEPMAIRITITSGFVSQENLVSSLTDGFNNSTQGNVAALRPQIDQFRKCFSDQISKGDTFDLVYIPTHGVIVNKNGKLKGVVSGVEFKQALFGIWLSDNPADSSLKQALLSSNR
jgi:hypothetical protein